ncbi:MAG: histidine phosphatase family protein [Paracoccaceae bacterium]|nr:histidine phosphatase family protein [Paracoccaceae bacterium]
MNNLYLVRHGPTHLKSMVGWSDVPADLSDSAKIRRLRAYLPNSGKAISSDLKRARDTADALKLVQKRLPDDSNLREINFGDWELKPFAEIDKTDHDRVFDFYDNPGETSAPNGESWDGFCQRTNRAIDKLMNTYTGQPLIIVAHFGVIVSQIQRAEGGGAKRAMRHKIDNFSLTHLSYGDANWTINRLNFSA